MIDQKQLGKAIKRVREARGLSEIDLARTAGLGEDVCSVELIEQGKVFVSMEALNSLAKALDIPSACLAVLGSTTQGSEETIELIKNLQNLIDVTITAQAATK